MLEEERKFQVDTGFEVPSLDGLAPPGGRILVRPAVTLRATYYDTVDRRLARAGVSLRHRRGEKAGTAWTVKLPASGNARHELHSPGGPGVIPGDLVGLTTVYHRGAALGPAAVVRTVRRAYEVRDADDRVLAEIADDTVSVLDGRQVTSSFREIEVERVDGTSKLLDRAAALLRRAGAEEGDFVPKHVRALGKSARKPPDLPRPAAARDGKAAEVVTAALRADIARVFDHDPWVRLRGPLPGGGSPVHKMRVGTRRLRSDLRTFGPVLDRAWAKELRAEVGWLAGALGGARDVEVLRARLVDTAGRDPLAPLDGEAVARLDAALGVRHETALRDLDAALDSERYRGLLDRLVDAARRPRLAGRPKRSALTALVARPWRRLVRAADLAPDAPDEDWHAVRVLAKRARYAAAAVPRGAALAKALARVQGVLGAHQDAALAGDTWLALAAGRPDDHALAITANRLYERERAAVRQARADYPAAWREATKRRVTEWLT